MLPSGTLTISRVKIACYIPCIPVVSLLLGRIARKEGNVMLSINIQNAKIYNWHPSTHMGRAEAYLTNLTKYCKNKGSHTDMKSVTRYEETHQVCPQVF